MNEHLNITLHAGNTYDLVTCNPPYVAFPPGLNAPLHSCGPDEDGLGYMRLLCQKSHDLLDESGDAYFATTLIKKEHEAEPYFIEELRTIAHQYAFAITIFIENYFTVEDRIPSLARALRFANPEKSVEQVEAIVRNFLCHTLRVQGYYVATIHLRKIRSKSTMRVFDRCTPLQLKTEEWQKLAAHPVFRYIT